MKKVLLFMVVCLIASVSFGQYATKADAKAQRISKPLVKATNDVSSLKATQAVIFEEGFEFTSEDLENGWTSVDQDGDANDWFVYSVAGAPHSGTYCMGSASWSSSALTPNNWLISPAIDLSSVTGTIMLSYWVAAQDPSWTSEHYKVVLSTTNTDPASFTNVLYEETLPGSGWFERDANISAYAGQTVYIAFVNYNCTDMFYIKIDDMSVFTNDVTDAAVLAITEPNHDLGCGLDAAQDITITIKNNGGSDITGFDVSYSINGGALVTETVGATITPASEYDYTFTQTADMSAVGEYTIEASVALTGDVNSANDTYSMDITSGDAVITIHALTDAMGGQSWQVINNLTSEIVAERTIGWQWNVEVTENVCVISDNCYTVIVSDEDADGMVDGTAYLEILYNAVQVAGSTTPDSWTTATLTAENLGDGCPANDAEMIGIAPIMSSCEMGAESIVVTIKNAGTDDFATFDVQYIINSGTPVTETVNQTVAAGDTYEYTFTATADFSADGIYTIDASVILTGDENTANDDAEQFVVVNVAPSSLPYTADFNTEESLLGWGIEDVNADDYTWTVAPGFGVDASDALGYPYNSANAANDWVYTTCIDLNGGTTYKVEFAYAAYNASYPENLAVAYGPAQSATDMINIASIPAIVSTDFTVGSYQFTPATTGTYYIGFQCYSDADMYYLLLDNVLVDVYTSVNNEVADLVSIYPNPSNGVVNIAVTENSVVSVMDVAGRTVAMYNVNANEEVSFTQSAGMYIVKVESNGKVSTHKLVIE